jgi:hypothetical protein
MMELERENMSLKGEKGTLGFLKRGVMGHIDTPVIED